MVFATIIYYFVKILFSVPLKSCEKAGYVKEQIRRMVFEMDIITVILVDYS